MKTVIFPVSVRAAARHAGSAGDKLLLTGRVDLAASQTMAELAKAIIRQQWPLRHHADPLRRAQAVSLIRTHVHLLRKWEAPQTIPR